jgi:CHASE3 domain sensor protein
LNAEKILQKSRSEPADVIQQQELADGINQIDKKWSTLHVCVKDYRDQLANTSTLHKISDDAETWLQQKTEEVDNTNNKIQIDISDANKKSTLVNQINQHLNEAKQFNDTKIKYLTQLAIKVYGYYYYYYFFLIF